MNSLIDFFLYFYYNLSLKGCDFMNSKEYVYKRKINYYETDRMGVVHHSNYIRFLEEARCYFMDIWGIPFYKLEEVNLTIPVLGVNCSYKKHVTFNDTLLIKVFVKDFNGVRLNIAYNVINEKTGEEVIKAETKHCFTSRDLKPVNLKKALPKYAEKFEELHKEFLGE